MVYPQSYNAALRSTSNPESGIYLSVIPPASDNPACSVQGTPPQGTGILSATNAISTRSPGATVDGHPPKWTVSGGVYTLSWQTSNGDTISLSEGSPESSAQADLTHIADTLQIGAIPLPLPIQIKGVPAAAQMEVGQIVQTNPQAGNNRRELQLSQIALYPGKAGSKPDQAGISVAPAGHGTGIPTDEVGACKTSGGLDICVTAPNDLLVLDPPYAQLQRTARRHRVARHEPGELEPEPGHGHAAAFTTAVIVPLGYARPVRFRNRADNPGRSLW